MASANLPTLLVLILFSMIGIASSFKSFQDRIPNGGKVPHPCKPNQLWYGVGHKNRDGGGSTNPFGTDFKINGFIWDKCLCERDSDGDGKTNGEELGDPDCVWTVTNDIPSRTINITHPGICDPHDSTECDALNDWEICTETEFECAAISEPDVKSVDIRFPPTDVPGVETTYVCMTFDLPQDGDYHVIADKPIIDNDYVMHHILMYGCDDGANVTMNEPQSCEMGSEQCLNLIALWTVGHLGTCHKDEYGFRIGQNGFKRILMQFHWNNPEEKNGYRDSSGMTLYYTANRRDHNAGMLMLGQVFLAIPPDEAAYTLRGSCPKKCTDQLPYDINLASAIIHMHYLGVSGSIVKKRGGKLVKKLVNEPDYSYDRPKFHEYSDPIPLKRGDTIDITCTYKSTSKSDYTYYGDATSDEMCYGFLIYYPQVPELKECLSYREEYSCPGVEPDWERVMGDCNYEEFFSSTVPNMVGQLLEKCPSGCTDGCQKILDSAFEEPCMDRSNRGFTEPYIVYVVDNYYTEYIYNETGLHISGEHVVGLLHTCDKKDSDTDNDGDKYNPGEGCGLYKTTTIGVSSADNPGITYFAVAPLHILAAIYCVLQKAEI